MTACAPLAGRGAGKGYGEEAYKCLILRASGSHHLKEERTRPFLKMASQDLENVNSYRTMANVPFLSKILEEMGATQILVVRERGGTVTPLIFLDLPGTFDAINHGVLLGWLSEVRAGGSTL